MKGFVALTTDKWCVFLKEVRATKAVFWRKRLLFRALDNGDKFYFLNRNLVQGKRYIVGCARFEKFEIVSADVAWSVYGDALGSKDEEDVKKDIRELYKSDDIDLGCIHLSQLEFYSKPVTLEECNVYFSPYTVSGKKISASDCKNIDSRVMGDK